MSQEAIEYLEAQYDWVVASAEIMKIRVEKRGIYVSYNGCVASVLQGERVIRPIMELVDDHPPNSSCMTYWNCH